MLNNLMLFMLIYIIVLIIYYFVIIRKYKIKKKNKKKRITKKKKELVEISLLEHFYKLDISKLNYNKLLNICLFVSSFDISILVYFIGFVKESLLQIIITMVVVIPVIFASYYIVDKIYELILRKDDKNE